MWGVSALLWIHVWRLHDPHPALHVIKPGMLTILLAVGLWIASSDPARRLSRLRSPVFTLFLVLVAAMVLSVPGSLWIGRSIKFMLFEYSMTFLLLVVVAASVRSVRDVEWLVLMQLVGGALFGLERLMKFNAGGGARLGTGYYDANDVALMMVCALPFALYFLRRAARGWQRAAALTGLLIVLLVFLRTISRGGFLALVAVTLYVLFRYRALKASTRVLAVAAATALIVGLGSQEFWTRIETILRPSEDYNAQSNVLSGRMAVWKRGVGYMVHNPLFGVGVQAFGIAEGQSPIALQMYQAGRGFKWSVAHNSFVEIGAEIGLIGLAVYVGLFIVAIRLLNRIHVLSLRAGGLEADGALAQTLVASFVGFMVAGFFLSQAYYAFPHALFAIALGLIKLHPQVFVRRSVRPSRRAVAAPVPQLADPRR